MSAISKLTTELSPEEKRALLAQLLQKKASQSKSLLPLSPGQQALWFLYTLAPQSWTYNVLFAARIRSPVDVPALQRAFGALIDRHPSLRTTYTLREGRLVQQVHEHTHVHFEETDASTCTQTALNNRLVEEARRPFDLERGPLLRVNLFTQSATEHILLLTMHHIAVDFWSLTVLLDELRVLYPAQRAGTQAPLLPLDWQYTDYVRWQTEMLASGEGERLWTYWQKQLAGELPVLNLPTDRPRPPIQTYRGASHAFKLSEELTQKIKALAKTEEATLYITLLAAFQVLLYRYTGQKDILVGSPAPGRSRREFSGIVGDFINPVVLRADLSGNPTFKPFLTQVRHTVLNALNHQDYPFPLLIERLRLTQDPSRSPLFGVMLIVRKLHRFEELSAFIEPSRIQAKMNFGGLEIEPFDLVQQEGQYDLTLAMIETGGLLFGVFKYKPDLFEAATIARMSGHFQTLLEGVVTNPNQPISTLPLLRAAERHQLLVEWNDTQVDYPKDACIHQLFEAQVERAPEAIAVVFEDQQLSYRELNGRANQLAHHLIGLGVGPGVLVGILVERSLNMIVGLLGILKAGGAYVPLEPAYPTERLGFMLSDAALPVVVTQQGFDSRLPANGAKLVWLDSDRSAIAAQPDHNPVNRDADALAYVIYTSGSTGTPKGVMVEHGSLVNYSASAVADYALRATDRVLQFASINFDASAEEIYPSLIQGATLVLRNDEMLSSAAQFLRTCADWKVSVLSVPTAWWHEIAASVIPEELTIPPSLRLVIIGGEAAAAGRLASWQQWTGSRVELINTYGPTEATVVATRWKAPLAINDLAAVPIGRPIANTQVYLLDPRLSPAPIGVAGELHIGGAGLARGYLNRPELTADKFIPNPFSDETNARLYKTGDLARYLPDGNIEFLGRMDHQVKIRGFRIELGEIESVLNEHPDVKVCAVIAREDQPNDKRLVAYIVSAEPPPVASGVLRESLRQKLPDYMLPSAFIGLDKLPLTPNGKLDRKALPAPDRLRSDSAPVAPRTPLEQQLAAIFASVLKIDRVGIHDNFFDLGGHSFLVLRVLAEIEKACGRRLSVATLFQAPTVEEIGRILTAGDSFDDSDVIVPLNPHGTTPPLFSVWMGIATELREFCRHLGAEQRLYGISSHWDPTQMRMTRIEEMAAFNLTHLRKVQPRGPYYLSSDCVTTLIVLEMAQQLLAQGEEIAALVLIDPPPPRTYMKMPTAADRYRNRVERHLRSLANLNVIEQLAYLLRRVLYWLNVLCRRIALRIFLACRLPLSRPLLSRYTRDTHQRAKNNYVPKAYPGKIWFIWAAGDMDEVRRREIQNAWSRLAAQATHRMVPGVHVGLFKEPRVGPLAEQMSICLAEARRAPHTSPGVQDDAARSRHAVAAS